MPRSAPAASCPCGRGGRYETCCARWHDGDAAPDAETLMHSRYSAYALGKLDYLLVTWHPDTRPAELALDENARWLGLEVKRHASTGPDRALVEFVARYRIGGGRAVRLHEISRFLREDGRWLYVDGVFPDRA